MGEAAAAAQSRWVEWAGRAGYAAKGVLYLVVGLLAIQIPLDLGGRATDRQGALRTVAQQPFGEVLLLALGAGLAGYALWGLAQAIFDRGGEGDGATALAKRAGYLGRALLYGGSAFAAFAIVAGLGAGGGNEQQEAANVLSLPLGRSLVFGGGLAFLAAGGYNAYRAATRKFRKKLRRAPGWAVALGVLGHAARAAVFGLIGVFLCKAAREYDPSEAKGLDGALRTFAQAPYGRWVLFAVAAGLLAYAAFCFVEARYKRI
jgi:hypothetical protein